MREAKTENRVAAGLSWITLVSVARHLLSGWRSSHEPETNTPLARVKEEKKKKQ